MSWRFASLRHLVNLSQKNSRLITQEDYEDAPDLGPCKCIIWEDGTGSAEREIARLQAAGESKDVEFVIVSWLR